MSKASLGQDVKHPWILPKKRPVETLIIRHYHTAAGHLGCELTLAEIRQKFWIIRGRAAVKNILHTCVPCRKKKAPTTTHQMADLPKDRVTAGLPPLFWSESITSGHFSSNEPEAR